LEIVTTKIINATMAMKKVLRLRWRFIGYLIEPRTMTIIDKRIERG
jgi:hypothetical protein